jgi:hypothetical protein
LKELSLNRLNLSIDICNRLKLLNQLEILRLYHCSHIDIDGFNDVLLSLRHLKGLEINFINIKMIENTLIQLNLQELKSTLFCNCEIISDSIELVRKYRYDGNRELQYENLREYSNSNLGYHFFRFEQFPKYFERCYCRRYRDIFGYLYSFQY